MNLKDIVKELREFGEKKLPYGRMTDSPAFQELERLAETEMDATDVGFGKYNAITPQDRSIIFGVNPFRDGERRSLFIGVEDKQEATVLKDLVDGKRYFTTTIPHDWEIVTTNMSLSKLEQDRIDVLEGKIINFEARLLATEKRLLDIERSLLGD